MRRTDDTPFDPEIAEMLEAIDATLAGEAVDPRHAEVAELALLLVADPPRPAPEYARELDRRVQRRFASSRAESSPARRTAWWQGWKVPLGASAVVVSGVIALVAVMPGGGSSSSSPVQTASSPAFTSTSSAAGSGSAGSAATSSASVPAAKSAPHRSPATSGALAAPVQFGAILGPATPAPVPNGRKLIQSAQLALSAPGSHIDDVAQELFGVVGRENGYVQSSQVTQGANGYAQFQLSVPTAALQATMDGLSALRYASVISRTDATQDVNGSYLSDVRALRDARAFRTSLLKALAGASTQTQIDSLTAQIHDAEASIRSDESTLAHLNHSIDYSQVNVNVNSAVPVPVTHHGGGGFTISRAAHDAGRALTVMAGAALIGLAVFSPIALVVLAAALAAGAMRRRRREQALDLAV